MHRRLRSLIALCTFVAGISLAQPLPVGDLNTPREFPSVDTRAAWEKRAEEIRTQALVSCGLWPMPEKTPLQTRIFGRLERDGYTIEKVLFQPSPGVYVGGNLYRPRGKGKFPGVLIALGHWAEGRLVDNDEASAVALGCNLARQGIVAFAYDMIGYNDNRFADSPPAKNAYNAHRAHFTNRTDLLWNISLMGMQTWNSIRALDFLEALPDVDGKRLGCTGASGGGTQTFMLGLVDKRLTVQAPVCMVSHTMQGGCACENAPGLRVEYSNMELAAAAAPRPQLLVAATGDWTRATLEVEGPAVARIYDLVGARDRLRYQRFDANHNYNQASREAVYQWFGQWLLQRPDAVKEQPHLLEQRENLLALENAELPADALSSTQYAEWWKQRASSAWAAAVPKSTRGLKAYRSLYAPLWQTTLQVAEHSLQPLIVQTRSADGFALKHSAGTRVVEGWRWEPPQKTKLPTLVILAGETGREAALIENARALTAKGFWTVVISNYSRGQPANQFTNFYTTYNRTLVQERVRDLLALCQARLSLATHAPEGARVVLWGFGEAGLWTLLAARAADAVVADASQLNINDDEQMLNPERFTPGLRNFGAFEGTALLAAPNRLLLHNTGGKFTTSTLTPSYRALGAQKALTQQSAPMSSSEIISWISKIP